jgi:hypothetical protein
VRRKPGERFHLFQTHQIPEDFARPPIIAVSNRPVSEIPGLFSPSKLGGANVDTGLTRGFRIGGRTANK